MTKLLKITNKEQSLKKEIKESTVYIIRKCTKYKYQSFTSFTKVLLLSNNSSNIAYVVKLSKINNIFEKNISHIL